MIAYIVGASGYAGAELFRILIKHRQIEKVRIFSDTHAGISIRDLYNDIRLEGDDIRFESMPPDSVFGGCDVLFLAVPNSTAMGIAEKNIGNECVIVDLSADFRLRDVTDYEKHYGYKHVVSKLLPDFYYGLPELNRDAIKKSRLISNPGCYPTSAILALAPLLSNEQLIDTDVICNSISGVSGAGRKDKGYNLFCETNENVIAYRPYGHPHSIEIIQKVEDFAGVKINLSFTPLLAPVNRGIISTLYVKPKAEGFYEKIINRYEVFYADEPFVEMGKPGERVDLRSVVGTNICKISAFYCMDEHYVKIFSVIDNLIKGAAGQAVQNMNLAMGFDETEGLM
ncbi:MAG: N-acetyl-gamma-glutamyl-phosphate reductase [Actinobacteria bacterium]|nr:N-acetyl-gamma-glutamyl-phosphate reductase [Actinomycetota bacterium]